MRHDQTDFRHQLGDQARDALQFLNAVVDEETLPAPRQLVANGRADELFIERHQPGLHGQPVGRRGLDQGQIAQAQEAHLERARDRGGRERQAVDRLLDRLDPLLLAHAESVLLIDDQQAEVAKLDVALQQPVRADDDVHAARGQFLADLLQVGGGAEPAHQLDAHRKGGEAPGEGPGVLPREQRGRHQDSHLFAVHGDLEGGPHGDLGLAVADVAADQQVHGMRLLQRLGDLLDRPLLVGCFLILETGGKGFRLRAVGREGVAGGDRADRVQVEQIFGQFFDRPFGPFGGAHPGRAAQPIQAGMAAFHADIFLDQVEPVERHIDFVAARIREFQKIAFEAAEGQPLEPLIAADAVAQVDDVAVQLELLHR